MVVPNCKKSVDKFSCIGRPVFVRLIDNTHTFKIRRLGAPAVIHLCQH